LVLCEQIRTIDKGRLRKYVCDFTEEQMAEVSKCIMNSLGL
jgi:mRNA-degrading endonuclease toxin of MazEF toxin-antitoxin module